MNHNTSTEHITTNQNQEMTIEIGTVRNNKVNVHNETLKKDKSRNSNEMRKRDTIHTLAFDVSAPQYPQYQQLNIQNQQIYPISHQGEYQLKAKATSKENSARSSTPGSHSKASHTLNLLKQSEKRSNQNKDNIQKLKDQFSQQNMSQIAENPRRRSINLDNKKEVNVCNLVLNNLNYDQKQLDAQEIQEQLSNLRPRTQPNRSFRERNRYGNHQENK